MHRYNILIHFFQKYTLRLQLLFCLHFCTNFCTLLLPVVISEMYAHLLDFDSTPAQIMTNLHPHYYLLVNSFPLLFCLFSAVLVSRFLFDAYRKKQQGILSEIFQHEVRQSIFRHHLNMSTTADEQSSMDRYFMRFSDVLSGISHFWSHGILQFGDDIMFLILGWCLIFFLHTKIALLLGIILGMGFLIFRVLNNKIVCVERNKFNKKFQMLSFFSTRLMAMASIQAFNRETAEQYRFENQSLKVQNESITYTAWVALLNSLIEIVLYLALGLSLLFMFYEKTQNLVFLNPPGKLAIILILLIWRQPLMRVIKVGLIWEKGLLSLDSLNQFFMRPLNDHFHVEEIKPTLSEGIPQVVLDIENIAFETNQPGVSKGQKITISNKGIFIIDTNHTHSWVKILAGLERHTEGSIKLGHQDIRQINPRVLRRYIAFASPIFPLYGKTVLESLTDSRKKDHREQMRQILKLWSSIFPALRTIRPDTSFHENGLGLSVLQHQLLRLLNGLSTKKPFLVLDEPLIALDSETAHKIWDLLIHEAQSKGILIVSKDGKFYKNLLAITLKNTAIEDNP